MASIFEQLGYNYTSTGNDVIDFNDDVLESLSKIPPLLEDWQYTDLQNQDAVVTNYLKNPVSNVTNLIKTKSFEIMSSCIGEGSNIASGLETIYNTANTLTNTCTQFVMHTDRLSGLVEPNENTASLPHYDMAIGIGKSVMYLIYQSDGIQNNAPIMGSFTSVFIGEQLENLKIDIQNYPNTISSSITCTTSGDPPSTSCSSNLTIGQITTINTKLTEINTLMNTRITHDENFYANSSTLLRKYQEMKRYKDVGQSERNLFDNYIGTERLKNNLP